MKKYLLAALLCGCSAPSGLGPLASKPAVVDGAAVGKAMAEHKVTLGTTGFHDIYKAAAFELLQTQDFAHLDELMQQLSRRDPVETLCTPSSLICEMPELQKSVGSYPWFAYFSQRWEDQTQSSFSHLARMVAFVAMGEGLQDVVENIKVPIWYEGKWYCEQGLGFAKPVKKGDPTWPYCEMALQVESKGQRKAILSEIHEYPQEIALYLRLNRPFTAADRSGKAMILKELQADSKASYALFFTVQLPKSGLRKISSDGWEWEALQAGFEQLLKEHPKALGVRNAYAQAASGFGKEDVLKTQAKELGYLWDPGLGGPPSEQSLSSTSLEPLALDNLFRQQQPGELASRQAQELLRRELWSGLDAYLAGLNSPGLLREAEIGLQQPPTESESAYQAHEKKLRAWQQARPNSLAASANLGGFYIQYGWLARGTGTADTVSSEGWTKFKARLKTSRDLLYQAFGAGYQSSSTMSNLMILYNAESSNLESARSLAIKAAKMGAVGHSTILAYAQMLLPRWQGGPGDMVAAADLLRKETGNDDAYYLMTSVAIEAEGLECLEAGHPVAMNWKRALASVLAAAKEGRLSARQAHTYLDFCTSRKDRKSAALLLPFVPPYDTPLEGQTAVFLLAEREWTAGKAAWPLDEPKYTFTLNGPRRQKAAANLKIGFTAHLSHPAAEGENYFIHIRCPLTDYEGQYFREYDLVDALYPLIGKELDCQPQTDNLGMLKPGKYQMQLFLPGDARTRQAPRLVHEETFEVLPKSD
ncbi:MAG: DUF4034 domain-containing protein [Candidatus Eremiobacteraeota bacterium]|nr:DUF4034 domain-containing protein [Candidatus Eremiobacteraeota bacterium]